MIFFEILLYLLSSLLIWQFEGYPLFMSIIAIYWKPFKKDYSSMPFVSIIVPTYNESRVIENKINNLIKLDYPKDRFEIIIVDSGSKDSTRSIAENYAQNNKIHNLIFINEYERKGKASAVNLGIKHSQGDIVMVSDANSLYDSKVLREIAPHFENSDVGAVSGRYIVSNPSDSLPLCESFYWDIEHLTFMGESRIDSVSTVIGTVSAWRKNLARFKADTIAEDLDMTITVRSMGYRVRYEPKAIAYESSAKTVDDQIKQRRRTSLGTIQNIYKHIWYFLLPRDIYSIFIFPSHKTLTMLSPFILFAIPVLYIIMGNLSAALVHSMFTILFFSVFFILLVLLKARIIKRPINQNDTRLNGKTILKIIYYVLLNEFIILLAWKDYITGNSSVLWEKAESTRM